MNTEKTPAVVLNRRNVTLHGKEYEIREVPLDQIHELITNLAELLVVVPLNEWEGLSALGLLRRVVQKKELYQIIKNVLEKASGIDGLGQMGFVSILKVLKAVAEVNELKEARNHFFELKGILMESLGNPQSSEQADS